MGAHHAHRRPTPASRRTVQAIMVVIGLLALVTVAGLIWLWPDRDETAAETIGQRVTGTILEIDPKPCEELPGEEAGQAERRVCGDARVELTEGAQEGLVVTSELPAGPGAQDYAVGEDVVLIHMPDDPNGNAYSISDHDRSVPLGLFGAAFALAVIAFGRWRGVTALIGLGVTFFLLLMFVIPAILGGESPLLVAIVGSSAIMLAVLYLTHGFTVPTSIAIVGTVASLSITGLLAGVAVDAAFLTGVSDESSLNLEIGYQINGQGLLLAAIIIGALGVLDDVTVTQSTTVGELARANPGYGFRRLYRAASRVGRAHIASVVNTIVLAYAGAALPLLLLISVANEPLGDILTYPNIAEEITRSIVGTLGLIAAVPITTALAAAVSASRRAPSEEPRD